jgi:hypothetical protein
LISQDELIAVLAEIGRLALANRVLAQQLQEAKEELKKLKGGSDGSISSHPHPAS